MLSNRVKRNVWLVMAVLSLAAVIDRAIRVIDGSLEWWELLSAVIITALCTKFYCDYRKLVKQGIQFGCSDRCRNNSDRD